MPHVFRTDAEYYVVNGWFEKSNGINEGVFYGACCLPNDPMRPVRVAIYGDDAVVASRIAAENKAIVHPTQLTESVEMEMVSSGAIAERPTALTGSINIVEPEILMTRNEKLKRRKKKPKMPHDNPTGPRMATISQSGGRPGGNPQ